MKYLLLASGFQDVAARTISISQPQLIARILKRFGMEFAANHSTPLIGNSITQELKIPPLTEESKQQYAAIVGSLMYLATRHVQIYHSLLNNLQGI
jgi:hypothetical protein